MYTIDPDGKNIQRLGHECCDPHLCLVVSTDEFNQARSGLVVLPLTSKTGQPQKPFWVRVRCDGEAAYVLCEQIRYVDLERCGKHHGDLMPHEMVWIENKLRTLMSLK